MYLKKFNKIIFELIEECLNYTTCKRLNSIFERREQLSKLSALTEKLDNDISLKGVLFLIGVQELNKGVVNFSKEDKVAVLHVAICSLLTAYGFFQFDRIDEDGWPHFELVNELPNLTPENQELLMKRQLVDYFASWISGERQE